jgi:1,4-alpha-glucan branching enzyme
VPGLSARRVDGALAILLHTHMPYVEGFGTWPFGEEWLWEAMAGSYLPLLELLEGGAPLTLSLTPVLCDQLEAPGIGERFAAFVEGVRRNTHAEDAAGLRGGGHEQLAREVERSWSDYERALAILGDHGGELLGAFAPYAQWTSSATHAVLPLLASDAGIRAQVHAGVRSHRRRFGDNWQGGFWLPECAYAPWLLPILREAGVASVCVELTNALGVGAPEHLRPQVTDEGVTVVPIDRATISLVWSEDGYPAAGAYRDYHHHTIHHHNPWNNAGEPYDHAEALALARQHAADFVARACQRLQTGAEQGGGLLVCALDTELLGHWWYEGVAWLGAVVEECVRQELPLVRLDDGLEAIDPVEAVPSVRAGSPSSWGKDGDLSTWSGPAAQDIAFALRAAELEVLHAGGEAGTAAVRELLALQSSDWAFMVSRELAGPYPRERFDGHRGALRRALVDGTGFELSELRNLAVDLDRSSLISL